MTNTLYIVWSDRNKIGVSIIDEQHRVIVAVINSLHYFLQSGQGYEAIGPTLNMLEQYIEIHFQTEEAIMAEANCSDLEEHIEIHNELREKTRNIVSDANLGTDPDMVLKFLREWWLGHINKEDRKNFVCFNKLVGARAS